MSRLLPPLLGLALAGCAIGDRGLETPHQPVVGKTSASVPNCPDWSTAANSGAMEGQSSNYGCATSSNLAAMIADPQDLLHGRADDDGAGEIATRAIKAWRETTPTAKSGLDKVSPKGGG